MTDELCDYCKEEIGEFRLSNGRCVCSKCFTKIAQNSNQKVYK